MIVLERLYISVDGVSANTGYTGVVSGGAWVGHKIAMAAIVRKVCQEMNQPNNYQNPRGSRDQNYRY